jgi:hypothetical protein
VCEGAESDPASGSIVISDTAIEAARNGHLVAKQGDFTGAPEAKP